MISRFLKISALYQFLSILLFQSLYLIHFGLREKLVLLLIDLGISFLLVSLSLLATRIILNKTWKNIESISTSEEKGNLLKKLSLQLTIISFVSSLVFVFLFIAVSFFYERAFDSVGHAGFFVGLGIFICIAFALLTLNHFTRLTAEVIARDSTNNHILKLSYKFVLPVISTVIFKNLLLGFLIYQYIYSSKINDSQQILSEKADANSKTIQAIIEVPLDEIRALSHIFDAHFTGEVVFSRNDVRSIFKNYLKARPNLLGVWYGFEPNQFDNQDASFANRDIYDQTGRMLSYLYYHEKQIKTEVLHDYSVEGKGDYYLGPIKSGKETVIGPYLYETNTGSIQTISLVVPVFKKGKTVGVVGIDFTNDFITEQFPKNTTDEYLVTSSDHTIVLSSRKELVGKKMENVYKEILKQISADPKNQKSIFQFQDNKGENYKVSSTRITLGSSESNWQSMLIASNQSILRDAEWISFSIFILILLISALVGFIVIATVKPLSASLNLFLGIFSSAKGGVLNVRCEDVSFSNNREVATLANTFNEFISKLSSAIGLLQTNTDYQVKLLSEFSGQSEELASSSQSQAASVEETTAALEEISASVDSIAVSASDQSQIADDTLQSSSNQNRLLETLREVTAEGSAQSENTFAMVEKGNIVLKNTSMSMNRIEESTQKIEEMVAYIQEISDQVNLLALNAAIEAARAGEQGRGFAVVASEIGKLADKTQANTKQISELVGQGISDTRLGSISVKETESIFSDILKMAEKTKLALDKVNLAITESKEESIRNLNYSQKLKELSQGIALSTAEQKTSNEEILRSVSTINESTQTIAISADEITRKAHDTKEKLLLIQEELRYYKI